MKTRRKIFHAIPRNKPYSGELQGIVEKDGTIILGIDAWRNLNRHDIASFPTTTFTSLKQMEEEYVMVKVNKGYYMPGKEYDGLHKGRIFSN